MVKGKVSIIIPVFNSGNFLPETLASISAQTYKNWECIFIDDGSSDNSITIIEEISDTDDRFIVVKRPVSYPKGGNSCRNYGYEISTGEFIQWFDSDDLMLETMIELKVNALIDDPINYVICETGFFEKNPNEIGRYEQNLRTNNLYYDYLKFRTKFFTPGPMFKKAFLRDMSLFNVHLKRHQEKEFFFRIILKDSNYGVIDDALILRRLHDSSLSVKVDAGFQKIRARFIADAMMFNVFSHTKLKNQKVVDYFQESFLRYSFTFLKAISLNMMFKAMLYYSKAVLKR